MKVGDLVRHWNTRYGHIGVITDKRLIGHEVNFKVHWNNAPEGWGWYSPDRLERVKNESR